jgi:class 3 adenylate cyclase
LITRLASVVLCPACGAESPARFRLCGQCGAQLVKDRPPEEIRRVVTVVTSDLKGSTSLGEKLDPESLREVLTRYFDEMRLVLESHGGTIEKIIGDAIVAVFGLPTRRDDDPVRAVAAAAETQRALAILNEALDRTWGVQLTTRTGIATGEVVVGEASAGQHVLTGPALQVATAMEQNAPAMEVLVDESTYRLANDIVEVEPVDPFVPKGMATPLMAFRLISVHAGVEEAASDPGSQGEAEGRICQNCGEDNPADFRLCGSCGASLATPVAAQESRKTVSIVFADPKPMTGTDTAPTPEALGDVMSRYFATMREILERHGGTVEKFIGDAVMAVFGLPVRHEDDALRATRSALEMQAALPALNEVFEATWGVTLRNHIGVNTGEVVAGDATSGQRLVTGDTVNVAARLEQAAGAREVLIGDLTYRLIRDAVDVEAIEPLSLKGKAEPVPAYRLLGLRTGGGDAHRQDAPMVGREAEFAQLMATFGEARSLVRARSVTVVGDAGVGKTRLTREFLDAMSAEALVLKGRCLPYGDGITFWPLIEVVREAAEIADEDSPESAMARLLEVVDFDIEVADRVASVVGLSKSSYQVGELFWGIRRFFELAAAKRPIVVLFDDIHWAEQTFLDLVDHLVEATRDASMLILCTARHDLLENHADWGEQAGSARIVLSPLSDADASRVVENLLGQAGLAEDARARIVAASEGNPLFVEQLLSMLIESGRLRQDTTGWTATTDLSDLAIPPTIHALLAARLDALPPEERAIIEPASVIGLSFPEPAVEALAPETLRTEIDDHLRGLARKQLVRSLDDQPDEDSIYRFHHLLIRDAAYQGLLKRSRALLHERFVAWADVVNAERGRATEFEEILGYHLEQAYRYRSELGPLDDHGVDLGIRAAERLGSAGSRAIARGDMPAAASLLGRAAAVLPAAHPTRPWLLIRTGEARLELGEFAIAAQLIDEAIDVAAELRDEGLDAAARIERLRLRYMTEAAGSDAQVTAQVNQLIPALEAAGDQAGLARAWRIMTYIQAAATQWGAAEVAATAMIDHARAAGDRLMETRGLPALAGIARYGPLPVPEALSRCEELLTRAGGDRRAEALIERAIAHLRAMQGDFTTAREIYARVRRTLIELGWNFDAALVSLDSGPIEMLAGDPAAAERELRRDYELLDAMGERNYISTTAAYLAEAIHRLGRDEEASALTDFAERVAAPDDLLTQFLFRGTRAKILARAGLVDQGAELAREAVRLAHTSDDPTAQGNALLDLAEVLNTAGQVTEVEATLAAAAARFEAKGNAAAGALAHAQLQRVNPLPPDVNGSGAQAEPHPV